MGLSVIMVLLLTLIITAASYPLMIRRMLLLQYGQQIREDGPSCHFVKAGTPTMGGLIFIPAAALVALIFAGPSMLLLTVLLVTIGCGLIGFLDDYFKIARGRSLGLKARSKLTGLALTTLLLALLLWYSNLYSSLVAVPFSGITFDIGWFYPILMFLLISGFSNSVNLTDGIDGLAAGASLIAFIAYGFIAYLGGLLDIMLFSFALVGACGGFLIYNRHPARIFMGDVGSLALGGALAAMAIVTKTELILLLVGAVFFVEALSVITQVISFRLTGRRILLMSPLHHHFELKGWSEWRVVASFWGAALLFAFMGVLAYKY